MNPDNKLKLVWLFFFISVLICAPAAGYYFYKANRISNTTRHINQTVRDIVSECGKMNEVKEGITEETNRLSDSLMKLENYENPDFLDFIQDRNERLTEITDLLRNAAENLSEAEEIIQGLGAAEEISEAPLDIADTAVNIAKKKIEEARKSLRDYKGAI